MNRLETDITYMTEKDVIKHWIMQIIREYRDKILDNLIIRRDNDSQYISREFNEILNRYLYIPASYWVILIDNLKIHPYLNVSYFY